MRHVGDELPLHVGEFLELAELALQAGRHLVERRRQRREVVHAAHLHALPQVPGRQALGSLGGVPDGQHHPPGHQRRDGGQQHDNRQAHADQDALHQQQGRLLLGEREHVIQLVVRAERYADGERGYRGALPRVVDQRGRLVARRHGVLVVEALALLVIGHPGDQGLRDGLGDVDVGVTDPVHDGGDDVRQLDEDQVTAGAPAGLLQRPGGGPGHTDRDRVAGLRAEQVHGGLPERVRPAVIDLGFRGGLRAAEQPGRDRLDQEEAEHRDDQDGKDQGGRDHPKLQRTVPAEPDLGDDAALPPAADPQPALDATRQPPDDGPAESRAAEGSDPVTLPARTCRYHLHEPGLSQAPPCSRRRAPSRRSRDARGPSRSSRAAAARAR